MYNYEWDKETGGYILNTKVTGVIKEVRPVFYEELRLLGFDRQFGWIIPESKNPLMWAETRRYFYKGELVGEANGGGLYELPKLKANVNNLDIEPVDIESMVEKNKHLLNGLVQKTLTYIYETYNKYKTKKIDIFYVAFSGGKDSIVLLDLVQRALPNDDFVVVFGDTSMELEDTYKAVKIAKKRWDKLNWQTAVSHMDAKESWSKIGSPARALRWCCSVHKTAPSLLKLREIVATKNEFNEKANSNFKAMVFDGIRAEESDTRASYTMISESNKHAIQTNCSPIFEWNTSELFIYMFENDLFINDMYRKGASRVGCKICPMASNWYESILNHTYPKEISPLLNILTDLTKKDFKNEEEKMKYFQDGGWKSRVGGRELDIGENKIIEIIENGFSKFVIKNMNYDWKTWMITVGDIFQKSESEYSIDYKDVNLNFIVEGNKKSLNIKLEPLLRTKSTIRFMYLFKNALYKAAYCINCRVCMVECSCGALKITENDIEIKNCRHCESCLDSPKGCIVARSLSISGGGNNMSDKNISRYQNFGFRQDWLELFFELRKDFWSNERMGKYMFVGFRSWLKEAGLTENNAITEFGMKLAQLGSDNINTWALIYNNLAYESPVINWFVKNVDFNQNYLVSDYIIMLGNDFSETTKKNALASLKETIKSSPIGWGLGQGDCETKGKVIVSITKYGWQNPEPLAILYSVYKFAEKSDKYYNFTLTDLLDDSPERIGLSPTKIFNINRETLKQIFQGLSHDYNDYIKVTFNKDLENVNLNNNYISLDIVKLF